MNIKRHFYNKKHYIINKKNKTVDLLPLFHNKLLYKKLWGGNLGLGFKKIGGSLIGDVLELDQWKSPFLAFCKISYISIPILDRKYVNAGIYLEPMVLKVIEDKMQEKIKRFSPVEYAYDYFKDKDDVMGGLPDGLLTKSKIVLEIKTSKETNLEKWNRFGVPISYIKQVELYTYLMGLKKYSIIAIFLKEKDYHNLQDFPIKKRKIKSWKSELNEEAIKDDISKIKTWYYKYTKLGISPKYDVVKDADQLEYLECQTLEEWEKLQEKWQIQEKIPNE